ncbi:hypothetical protein WICPIJ_003237 [Wickerhamomyces pijperi]|uniref:RING-type domain-containing protein n=1 Tax=Wickerhamomyces pijperi TaxID=599730 RepID=A0A9P8TP18_WICPI|nr:hypothetical protein WICPIJ_003237 [Wickerhamomyces pijperi]
MSKGASSTLGANKLFKNLRIDAAEARKPDRYHESDILDPVGNSKHRSSKLFRQPQKFRNPIDPKYVSRLELEDHQVNQSSLSHSRNKPHQRKHIPTVLHQPKPQTALDITEKYTAEEILFVKNCKKKRRQLEQCKSEISKLEALMSFDGYDTLNYQRRAETESLLEYGKHKGIKLSTAISVETDLMGLHHVKSKLKGMMTENAELLKIITDNGWIREQEQTKKDLKQLKAESKHSKEVPRKSNNFYDPRIQTGSASTSRQNTLTTVKKPITWSELAKESKSKPEAVKPRPQIIPEREPTQPAPPPALPPVPKYRSIQDIPPEPEFTVTRTQIDSYLPINPTAPFDCFKASQSTCYQYKPSKKKSLPKHYISKEDTCPICIDELLEAFFDSRVVFVLPCNHMYHRECVDTIFKSMPGRNKNNFTCLICNLDLKKHYFYYKENGLDPGLYRFVNRAG